MPKKVKDVLDFIKNLIPVIALLYGVFMTYFISNYMKPVNEKITQQGKVLESVKECVTQQKDKNADFDKRISLQENENKALVTTLQEIKIEIHELRNDIKDILKAGTK